LPDSLTLQRMVGHSMTPGARPLEGSFAETKFDQRDWRVQMGRKRKIPAQHNAHAARIRALAADKNFLTLWKNAAPDIPVLKQAKAEHANLHQ